MFYSSRLKLEKAVKFQMKLSYDQYTALQNKARELISICMFFEYLCSMKQTLLLCSGELAISYNYTVCAGIAMAKGGR